MAMIGATDANTQEGVLTSAGRTLVACLRAQGVETIFGVPGESYLEVLDALYETPEIKFICCRHEGAASNMAEADGKLTGRPGICIVTRGPGATHAAIGVHTASQDSTPMILLIGQVPRAHHGREAWQEIDYEKMFGGIAKWVAEISEPERTAEYVARAFAIATSGRPGPVVLSLPEDVLVAKVSSKVAPTAIGRGSSTQSAPAIADMQTLEAELLKARQPVVLVGGSGWSNEDCAAFQEVMAKWDLPVAASFRRQDLFDNNHPNYIGHVGLGIDAKLAARIRSADLIVAVGCRINEPTTGGYALLTAPRPRQRLIHVHADANELGRVYHPDLAICASPRNFVTALQGLKAPASASWKKHREEARRDFEAFTRGPAKSTPAGVDMAKVVSFLSDALPANSIVTNGAGNYTVWVHRFYRYRQAHTQLAPVSGAMGYGLPAAIAAKVRHPEQTTVCFAGDGCFLMYPQELSTAIQIGAAIIVLVVNNGLYGTIRMHQARHYPGRPIGTDIAAMNVVGLAQSFGAYAERVERTEDFAAAFERARASGRAAVLDLVVDPLQITPDGRLDAGAAAFAKA
jgi:acetolactate synthase-1/2/3 large subunit